MITKLFKKCIRKHCNLSALLFAIRKLNLYDEKDFFLKNKKINKVKRCHFYSLATRG